MNNQISNIRLLLRISESIESKDTLFKRKLFNLILLRLKFKGELSKHYSEDLVFATEIISFIGSEFKLEDGWHLVSTNKRKYVVPKHIAITMIYDNTINLTLWNISDLFQNEHAMVLYSHKTVDNLIDTDKNYKKRYEYLLNKMDLKYKKYKPKNL